MCFVHCINLEQLITIFSPLQKLVDCYYGENYTYDKIVEDLFSTKEIGDEFTLLLASKWLKKNITVITVKKDWMVYPNCKMDIVVTYKGKDQYTRSKWVHPNQSTEANKRNQEMLLA